VKPFCDADGACGCASRHDALVIQPSSITKSSATPPSSELAIARAAPTADLFGTAHQ
jgi:hypothetical protein